MVDEDEINFIHARLNNFIATLSAATIASRESAPSAQREQWSGMIPFLRLIHCLVDHDEIREAFKLSFTVMTHQELDDRSCPENQIPDPWTMVADKFNDPNYAQTST